MSLKIGTGGRCKTRRYLKTRGLVQGDPLSAALCDLYYGDMVKRQLEPAMEKAVLASKKKGTTRLFVRGVDDFAFASTDEDEARAFLGLMEAGFPDYGCVIRREKTVTNLGAGRGGGEELAFCGAMFGAESPFGVRPDFTSYHGSSIVHTLKLQLQPETAPES